MLPQLVRLPVPRALQLVTACCVLVCPACSSQDTENRKPTFPVTGQVLLEGKPTSGAVVVFFPLNDPDPQAPRSYARTGADGTFTLSTYITHDGAPAGRYAITVLWQDGDEGTNRLPPRYGSPDTSGLRVEVKQGANELSPFRLRRS